jgi:putative ABC transport system substrate-binding protein
VLALGLLTMSVAAPAQPGARVPRIGFLAGGSASTVATTRDAVVGALGDLGYRDGESMVLEERYADGRLDRLPALAGELVRRRVDVILTQTTAAVQAAKRATPTIPIVVVTSGDLVGAGVVQSLARPGGNVTGLSFLGTELAVKQLELLREIAPGATRVGFLTSRAFPPEALFFREMEQAAPRLGLSVRSVETTTTPDYPAAFAEMVRQGVDGLVVAPGNLNFASWRRIVDLAARHGLPAIYPGREFVDAGGLVSYFIDRSEFYRRAALFVDKILRGIRPADLPIEQPTTFELVINLRTARSLGLTVPPSLLARTDRVVQ